MSCYFRHLKSIFEDAGIEVTKENKKLIDQEIHKFVGVPYKHCPETWNKVKEWLKDEENKKILIDYLKKKEKIMNKGLKTFGIVTGILASVSVFLQVSGF